MIWGEYERNQLRCGVMCEEAPVSVFQSVAARERSQLAREEEERHLHGLQTQFEFLCCFPPVTPPWHSASPFLFHLYPLLSTQQCASWPPQRLSSSSRSPFHNEHHHRRSKQWFQWLKEQGRGGRCPGGDCDGFLHFGKRIESFQGSEHREGGGKMRSCCNQLVGHE